MGVDNYPLLGLLLPSLGISSEKHFVNHLFCVGFLMYVHYTVIFTYNFLVHIGYMEGFPPRKCACMQGHTGQEPHSSKAKAIFVLTDVEQIV